MARGGARSGTPGKAYQNRSDLQGAKAPTGMPYGEHKQLVDAQHAVPLPNSPSPPASGAIPVPLGGAGGDAVALGDFNRPTERPTEPVTAGLPIGPGPGPEALGTAIAPPDIVGAQLRAAYAAFPNDDLLRVMALHDRNQ